MNFKKEVLRKSLHLPGVLFILTAHYHYWASLLILSFLVVTYFISYYLQTSRGKGLPVFGTLTQFLKRDEELDLGPPLLGLGILFSLLFFKSSIATCAILQVCMADTMACLSGKYFDKAKVFYSPKKSYLGCGVFFITSFLIQIPFVGIIPSLILAFVGMLLESLPFGSWDNLIIPVGVSFLAYFMGI